MITLANHEIDSENDLMHSQKSFVVKDRLPFYVGMFSDDYIKAVSNISLNDFYIETVSHSFANDFVLNHHYLHRKLYIAKNVSYGLYVKSYCVGICMFGYPVWRVFLGIVPPYLSSECPELLRLCTLSDMPKNTESWFVSRCIKRLKDDWTKETGSKPKCVTSLCDVSLGFDGALYRALNFKLVRRTIGRSSNPGGKHGRRCSNDERKNSAKDMYVLML